MLRCENRDLFLEVERIAASYPPAKSVRREASILVEGSRPDGFDIVLVVDGEGLLLWFDCVFLEVGRTEQVRHLIRSALAGELRIKVDMIGGRPWQWTLEQLGPDLAWTAEYVMGRLVFRFWQKRTVAYLRNEFGSSASVP